MPRRSLAVLGTLAAATALAVGVGHPAAQADSGIRVVYADGDGSSNEECAGQWLSDTNDFRLQDRDLADDDWCYIDYRLEGQDNTSRFSIPQDQSSRWYEHHVKNPNAVPRIEFKVCQERQDDPDLCLDWRWYKT